MNNMFGISSRALSGRTGFIAMSTQGIARARSALGCILAALQAASRRRFPTFVQGIWFAERSLVRSIHRMVMRKSLRVVNNLAISGIP